MKKMKLMLLAFVLMMASSLQSFAVITIDCCVKSHPPKTNCYELFITITDVVDGVAYYITSGSVWVGDDCPPHLIAPPTNPNCPNYTVGNQIFFTEPSGTVCMSTIMSDPNNYSNYVTQRDYLINNMTP